MPHGAPGDEGASLQGGVFWVKSVLGLLVSRVGALMLLCAGASLLGVKDTPGLGEQVMQSLWDGICSGRFHSGLSSCPSA